MQFDGTFSHTRIKERYEKNKKDGKERK